MSLDNSKLIMKIINLIPDDTVEGVAVDDEQNIYFYRHTKNNKDRFIDIWSSDPDSGWCPAPFGLRDCDDSPTQTYTLDDLIKATIKSSAEDFNKLSRIDRMITRGQYGAMGSNRHRFWSDKGLDDVNIKVTPLQLKMFKAVTDMTLMMESSMMFGNRLTALSEAMKQ